jgi:hypothetical protein
VVIAESVSEQKRYWEFFVQTYGHSRYLHKYYEKCERIDRTFSMITAIASSSSIGGWVIWRHAAWVWGAIIAASQVITAVKSYLPYARRAELLRELSKSYAGLATRVEGDWFLVKSGALTEDKINKRILAFKKEQNEFEEKLFQKVTLPTEKNLLLEAEQDTKNYFARYYG